MTQLIAGAISSKIRELSLQIVQDLSQPNNKVSINDFIALLESEPTAKLCCELKATRASRTLGDYENENKKIQQWMTSNFENMDGDLPTAIRLASSAMPLGRSTFEIIYKSNKIGRFGEWKLKELNVLDPQHIVGRGDRSGVVEIKYNDGVKEVYIPINKCLHIVNGSVTNFGRRKFHGSAEMMRAYPYMKLKQLIFGEMALSAKRLATGIIYAKGESNNRVQLYDQYGKARMASDGQPMTRSVTEMLGEQLAGLENNSYIVTDKANDIGALAVPAGEQFWNLALMLVNKEIMKSFLVPTLIFEEGSGTLGVNGLGNTHLSIMDATIEALVQRMRDEIIEKICKPLIISKFGKQEDYGSFHLKAKADPTQENMMLNTLISATSMGILSSQDYDVVNKIREYVGLAPVSKEENDFKNQIQQQMKMIQEQQQQQPDVVDQSEENPASDTANYP